MGIRISPAEGDPVALRKMQARAREQEKARKAKGKGKNKKKSNQTLKKELRALISQL